MTVRPAKTLAIGAVFAAGLLAILGSNTQTPETPVSALLQIPGPSSMWKDVSPVNGRFTVLPFMTSVPIMKVGFSAPAGMSLHVTARDDSAGTPAINIPDVSGSTSMPTGFSVDTVDATQTPARWQITIKLPAGFQTTTAFTVGISEMSGGTESAPLSLSLVSRSYQLSVTVTGGGHVTSTPGGISCNSSTAGAPGCDNTFAAPAGGITLALNLNAQSFGQESFLGWMGDCSTSNSSSGPTGSTCTLTLDGTGKLSAIANFQASTSTPPALCPLITYDHFVGTGNMPQCQPTVGAKFGATCDSGGFYSCPAGSGGPFCDVSTDMLKQPGGCYVVDPSNPP